MKPSPSAKPVMIETERFVLRSLTAADISPGWISWLNDPEILEPLNTSPGNHTEQSLAKQLAGYNNWNHYQIGIFDRESGLHIGLHEMNVNRRSGVMQVNVLIGDKTWWGKGVVAETRNALLDHFFFEQDIKQAYGTPLARNYRMIFNYKNQGWKVDRVLEGSIVSRKTGDKLDQYRFVMSREDWVKLRDARFDRVSREAHKQT